MKPGTTFVGKAYLYRVPIEGRGGDSEHFSYYKAFDDAVIASALDGKNERPTTISVLEFSDGTFICEPTCIKPNLPPNRDEALKALTNNLTLAQRILLGIDPPTPK